MSASSMRKVEPRDRSARARFVDTVDFPTPPFPEATAILKRTPSSSCAGGCPPVGMPAWRLPLSSRPSTSFPPSIFRTASAAWRLSGAPTVGFSVWNWIVKATRPPLTARSRTKPNETMSRERPGNLTVLSASSTCSCVAMLFLLFEALVRRGDDRDRFLRRGYDPHDLEMGRTGQAALHHRAARPLQQPVPHCTDEDQRVLAHVLDLQELPDHEELPRRADAAGEDDERGREPHEVVQPREERPVPEDFVDERVGLLLGRQVDGQAEGAGVAVDLPLHRPAVGGVHEAGAAPGDDVDAHLGQLVAQFLDVFVDRIAAADARAAEDGDAVVLDALGLDLVEVVDRLPELVDGLVEDVRRIDAALFFLLLLFAKGLELRRGRAFRHGDRRLLHNPDVLRKLLELRLGGAGVGLGVEFDADFELSAGALDVGGGEAFVDERGREGLGGVLVGGDEELGVDGRL